MGDMLYNYIDKFGDSVMGFYTIKINVNFYASNTQNDPNL